jgi:hypothetical protein
MSTRATLRADLRRDLRDEDAGAYVWPDTVLNRHIQHAIDDLQIVAPRIARLLKTVPAAAQRIDATADVPSVFAWVEAVEYPVDRYPQCFLPFREEPGPKLYLLTDELPVAGDQLGVWYAGRYTVDDASSDLPARLEPVVLSGALAFACLDQAIDTIARLTPAGRGPDDYRLLGESARTRFRESLGVLRQSGSPPMWRPTWS